MKKTYYLSTMVVSVVLSVMATNYLNADSRAKQPNVVTAEEFVLINQKGDVVLRIGAMGQGWPGIAIRFGDNPAASMSLMIFKEEGVGFSVKIPGSNVTAGFLLHDNGTVSTVGLELSSGRSRTIFGIEEDGAPYLKLTDKNGKVVTELPQRKPDNRLKKKSSSQPSDQTKPSDQGP